MNAKQREQYHRQCCKRARISYQRKRQKQIEAGEAKFLRMEKDDLKYIKQHANDMTPAEIADYIGCTPKAVVYRLKQMGLR